MVSGESGGTYLLIGGVRKTALRIIHSRLSCDNVGNKTIEKRQVKPEWLDALPADDPLAQRSRRELRWINALMGNERWVLKQLDAHPAAALQGVLELGAGDGHLCRKISAQFPRSRVCGFDLIDRPSELPAAIEWQAGDITTIAAPRGFGVLVANLFLHHFTDEQLAWLTAWLPHVSLVIFNEPLRRRSSHFWGRCLHPLLSEVTRHDMHVSIDAGFVVGELSALWPALTAQWQIEEGEHWPGAYRSVWRRK